MHLLGGFRCCLFLNHGRAIGSIVLSDVWQNFIFIPTDSSSCWVSTLHQFKALGENFLRFVYQWLCRQESLSVQGHVCAGLCCGKPPAVSHGGPAAAQCSMDPFGHPRNRCPQLSLSLYKNILILRISVFSPKKLWLKDLCSNRAGVPKSNEWVWSSCVSSHQGRVMAY